MSSAACSDASHSLDLTDAGLASLQPLDDTSSKVWELSRIGTNPETDNIMGLTEISSKSDHSAAVIVARPDIGAGFHREDVNRNKKVRSTSYDTQPHVTINFRLGPCVLC